MSHTNFDAACCCSFFSRFCGGAFVLRFLCVFFCIRASRSSLSVFTLLLCIIISCRAFASKNSMGCGIGLRFHMAAATLEELNILRLHRFARNFGSSWLQRFAQLSLSVTAFLLRKVGALEFHRFVAVATYGQNAFEFEASRFRLFVSVMFLSCSILHLGDSCLRFSAASINASRLHAF